MVTPDEEKVNNLFQLTGTFNLGLLTLPCDIPTASSTLLIIKAGIYMTSGSLAWAGV